jgi:hypothetical protein
MQAPLRRNIHDPGTGNLKVPQTEASDVFSVKRMSVKRPVLKTERGAAQSDR